MGIIYNTDARADFFKKYKEGRAQQQKFCSFNLSLKILLIFASAGPQSQQLFCPHSTGPFKGPSLANANNNKALSLSLVLEKVYIEKNNFIVCAPKLFNYHPLPLLGAYIQLYRSLHSRVVIILKRQA